MRLEIDKPGVTIYTPAKVNFFLNIQSKREDGYHNLSMDLIPVSLFDQIHFKRSDEKGVSLTCNRDLGKSDDNLIVKAVQLLEQETGELFQLDINLEKKIPHGAGLGGGSSNAAATLVVINRWYDLNLSTQRLRELGAMLGADVPFFINPEPSRASGIGEILTGIPDFPTLYLILVFPNFGISTKEAYQTCQVTGEKMIPKRYDEERFKQFTPTENDFWLGLSLRYSMLQKCCSDLIDQNAIAAGMSGSGSCLFGVYFDEKERDKATKCLRQRNDWSIYPCKSLSRYSYPETCS